MTYVTWMMILSLLVYMAAHDWQLPEDLERSAQLKDASILFNVEPV